MKTRLAWCILAHLATLAPALAQDKDPWIGRRVFTQHGTVLKVNDQVVDDEGRATSLATSGKDRKVSRVYKVEHTNGEWLWLKDEKSGIAGWVQSKYAIPYEQAVDYYTNQIRANPSSSLYVKRGVAWKEKGENDIAISDYNEAIRLDPTNDTAYNNRGIAWSDKKDHDKAIADYNEAIRIDPKDASAYHNRGNAWSNKKEYDKAIADYNEAIRIDPKYAYPYNGRAWLWATSPDPKFRDGKKAVESANRACELNGWKGAYDLGTLAAAYAESGDFDKAIDWQEKANKLYTDPEDKKEGEDRLQLYRAKKPYRDEG